MDPKLDPNGLRDNGGPAPTIAVLAGSPAVDADYNGLTTTDQRGFGAATGRALRHRRVRADPPMPTSGLWQAVSVATGPNGVSRLLWTVNSDGREVLWYINPDGSHGLRRPVSCRTATRAGRGRPWPSRSGRTTAFRAHPVASIPTGARRSCGTGYADGSFDTRLRPVTGRSRTAGGTWQRHGRLGRPRQRRRTCCGSQPRAAARGATGTRQR